MDHALCIIHHVIGSLSDSTPCRCYRVPRHGTARHGLVKHKHRETINKRNVARIPRYVSLSRWNSTEGKCPRPLSPSLSFSPSSSVVFVSHTVLVATLFRSDFVSWFTRVTPSTLDHGSVVRAFHRILEHPRKDKPNHHFSIQPLDLSRMRTPGPLWWYYYMLFRYYAKLFSLFVRIYRGNLQGNQPSNSNDRKKNVCNTLE